MHLYIRADANFRIGTGHIMRCIALAQAWQDKEGEVTFISRYESDSIKERIIQEGINFVSIEHPDHQASDLAQTLSIIESKKQNHLSSVWLVLDGYHFTPEYQKAIRDTGNRILIIDDMNHLSHYHVDILLNQNIHAPDFNYYCDEKTTLLLGTRYVLLRREFLKYRGLKRQIKERAKNILVTLGGSDPDNITLKIIEALKLFNGPDTMARIIIGPANPHKELLVKALSSTHLEAELLVNPSSMPELMAWADIAISAGGSTCWELAFMALPSILMILSLDQEGIVNGLSRNGFALKIEKHTALEISNALSVLIVDHEKRRAMSIQGRKLIDGNGACRVVKEINNARS